MIGKEWTREFFNEYVIWLEHTLFRFLQKYNIEELQNDKQNNDQEIIGSFKNIIDSLGINTKENFIEYLLQSINNKRYPEMAFLLDASYIDDCYMTEFYFSLLKKNEKIVINEKDKIKGLKLLLSEFLYQCGHDDALKIQQSLLSKNIEKAKDKSFAIIEDKKDFTNVEVTAKNGEKKNIDVSYKTLRGLTTWYAVRNKTSSKITKNKKGDFVYREGDKLMKIMNNDVIEYISKDYS